MSGTNIAPNVGDIREENKSLNVLRGFENANRVDRALNSTSDDFAMGEWVKLNNDGKVLKLAASVDAKAQLVFRGTNGFDSCATGQITLFGNPSGMMIRTDNYEAGSYNHGDVLVAKLIAGKGTLVAAADAAEANAHGVARVEVVGDGFLDLSLL